MLTLLQRLKKGIGPASAFGAAFVFLAFLNALGHVGTPGWWKGALVVFLLTFVIYFGFGLLPFLFGQEYEDPSEWRIRGARPYVWGAVVLGIAAFVLWFVAA